MKLAEFSVKRRVTLVMFYIFLIFFGLFSLARLKIDLYPDIEVPMILIVTSYPGSSPQDIETLVTRPIEEAAVSVQGVKDVKSESKFSVSVVTLEFEWGYDMEQAETDTRRRLEMMSAMLPESSKKPIVFAVDPSMQPVIIATIEGDGYDLRELRKLAEEMVKPRIERIRGISTVMVVGGDTREISVRLDPDKIQAYSLNAQQIVGVLTQENMQYAAGNLKQGGIEFSIQTMGKYRSVEEIGQVLLGIKVNEFGEKIPILLRDVAEIIDDVQETDYISRVNNKSGVVLLIRKQSGMNTVEAAEGVKKQLPKILESLDPSLRSVPVFDQSKFIRDSISNLTSTAYISIFVVFMVLLLFLKSIRSSFIVAMAIPVSIVTTFAMMSTLGMSLNVISLGGLALAVGMLVDNAIVVLENIFRLRQEGRSRFEASVQGASQVGTAVMASTLTTIAVFLPILFVPGMAGIMFRDLSLAVCISLSVSLFVSLSFIPFGSYLVFGGQYKVRSSEDDKVLEVIRRFYSYILAKVLQTRAILMITMFLILVGSMFFFIKYIPKEFMPQTDSGNLNLKITTEVGNSVEETFFLMQRVDNMLREVLEEEELDVVFLQAGMDSENAFSAITSGGVHTGNIRVKLVTASKRDRSLAEITDLLRDRFSEIPGTKIEVSNAQGLNQGVAGEISLEIYKNNLKEARQLIVDLKKEFLKFPEIADAIESTEDAKPQIDIIFDREKMASMGITTSSVSMLIAIFFRGSIAGYYSEDGDEYAIRVRYDKSSRQEISQLEQMPVLTATGESIPLSSIAKIEQNLSAMSISRKNQDRYVSLGLTLKNSYTDEAGVEKSKDLDSTTKRVEDFMVQYHKSHSKGIDDWRYEISGTAKDFNESFFYLILAFAASILLVYMVMASQFESLRQPFIIIFTVPLAFIGVVLAYLITGDSIDVSGMIGCVMLVGIVVNNGIVMIDAANQYRVNERLSRFDAIMIAARTRLRPILLTSLTTILSMIPLVLDLGEGAETWKRLAESVIGGLTFASLLTLFVVPALYTLVASRKVEIQEEDGELVRVEE